MDRQTVVYDANAKGAAGVLDIVLAQLDTCVGLRHEAIGDHKAAQVWKDEVDKAFLRLKKANLFEPDQLKMIVKHLVLPLQMSARNRMMYAEACKIQQDGAIRMHRDTLAKARQYVSSFEQKSAQHQAAIEAALAAGDIEQDDSTGGYVARTMAGLKISGVGDGGRENVERMSRPAPEKPKTKRKKAAPKKKAK